MSEGAKAFQFPFKQRFNDGFPICSCCGMSSPIDTLNESRGGHKVHNACAALFDVVEEAKKDLAAAFEQMPAELFGDSKIVDRLGCICTHDGLRNLMRDLAQLLREKKDLLRRTMKAAYADIVARLRAAADRIRMGHLIIAALT